MSTAQLKFNEPGLHLWTSKEYYRMAEAGLFEGKRVELIGGKIIEMSAQSRPHVTAVKRATRAFEKAFGEGWFVQSQAPLDLDSIEGDSQPEPDVAVIAGEEDDYIDKHPTTAALVLEVSFATLKYDRSSKASLYASSGISDYWILNLILRQLEVYRHPSTDALAPFRYSYGEELIFNEGDSVVPLAKPDTLIAVNDLLPPRSRNELA